MKLTEYIGITSRNMHVKLRAVWRSFNFWQKNADSARTLEIGWNFDISQSSPKFMKLTELIGITSRNMHVQFEAVWKSLIFDQKMPTAPDLRKRMNFWHFLKVLQNSWNLQNLLESPPGTACEIWSSLEKFQFLTESCQQCRTLKRMKFWHFLKVLRNSWNLQNLLESPPGTCMWNLKQFGEVSIFDRKMQTAPTLEKGWNFVILSKFSEIHETYRSYWNHLQEHACEIWSSLEKFQFLTEKCLQCRTLEKGWTFHIFSKVSKIHETYRIYWNHYQKHAFEIWSSRRSFNFRQKNADSAGP